MAASIRRYANIPRFWLPIGITLMVLLAVSGCAQSPIHDGKQGDKAVKTGATAATIAPLTPQQQAAVDQAHVLVGEHRLVDAASALQLLIDDRPDRAGLKTRLAWVRQQQNRPEQAVSLYQQALKQNPSDVMAINNLAILLQQEGRFREASQTLKAGLSHVSDAPQLHYNLAVLSELYLLDLQTALDQYRIYQQQATVEDQQVTGWIADLERRLR